MAVERSLHRLLRIRELEEEQSRLAVESAMNELLALRRLQSNTAERDRRGRQLVEAGLRSGEIPDRTAGIEESRAAQRMALALVPKIWEAEQDIDRLRQDYLDRRVHRRQAETLIEEAEKLKAAAASKRTQQGLDEWYRHRKQSERRQGDRRQSDQKQPNQKQADQKHGDQRRVDGARAEHGQAARGRDEKDRGATGLTKSVRPETA